MNENQETNLKSYNAGLLLTNPSRGTKKVIAFKLLGRQYISKGVKRNKKYSFDDGCWTSTYCGMLQKLKMIAKGEVKRANDCKKSLAVGV